MKTIKGKLDTERLNLDQILLGGQSFTWRTYDQNAYFGSYQQGVITISESSEEIEYVAIGDFTESDIEDLFDTTLNIKSAEKLLSKDKHFKLAKDHISDIRVLSQPFNETVISFIISANNNIKRIRGSVLRLIDQYGESINENLPNRFPSLEELNNLEVNDYKKLGLGYRSPYIAESVRILNESRFEERIMESNNEDRFEMLQELPGVGPKVADCILVFTGLDRRITPIDTWTKKILVDIYGLEDDMSYKVYREYAKEMYNEYTAHAFQTLFEWYRQVGHKA